MSFSNKPVLVPQYMRKFSCIGPTCEDSCCSGWSVQIDEDTYKKYNRVRDSDLTFSLQKFVKRNRSNPSEANYAKIKMAPSGACPLLNEEKLCGVQLKLGEEYLSNTCAIYPRTTNEVNGVYERSATVSCPEVARLALLNPNGIEFDEIREDAATRYGAVPELDTHELQLKRNPKKYLWELRIFTIQVLQNRNYLLTDRLIILGIFYQKIQEAVDSEQVDQIPTLIASFTGIVEDGDLKQQLQEIPTQTSIQLRLLKEMADGRFVSGISSQRFRECYLQMLSGLGYHDEVEVQTLTDQYAQMYKAYYEPFIQEHEYILENYLVNYVFKNLFPFTGFPTLVDNYVILVIHYALIKLHMIGVGAHHKELTVDSTLKIIQSFAKTYEHNKFFLKRVFDLLKDNGFTTVPYMAILIKN